MTAQMQMISKEIMKNLAKWIKNKVNIMKNKLEERRLIPLNNNSNNKIINKVKLEFLLQRKLPNKRNSLKMSLKK